MPTRRQVLKMLGVTSIVGTVTAIATACGVRVHQYTYTPVEPVPELAASSVNYRWRDSFDIQPQRNLHGGMTAAEAFLDWFELTEFGQEVLHDLQTANPPHDIVPIREALSKPNEQNLQTQTRTFSKSPAGGRPPGVREVRLNPKQTFISRMHEQTSRHGGAVIGKAIKGTTVTIETEIANELGHVVDILLQGANRDKYNQMVYGDERAYTRPPTEFDFYNYWALDQASATFETQIRRMMNIQLGQSEILDRTGPIKFNHDLAPDDDNAVIPTYMDFNLQRVQERGQFR